LRLFLFQSDPPPLAAMREGAPLVVALALAGVAVARRRRLWGGGLLALAAWCGWFFRDPPRRCPAEPGVLYAPADGVVTTVDAVEWDWFFHGRALRIVIFLSIFDVHVNRSPAAGRLVAYRRDPGGFAPAFLVGPSERNARQLLGIEMDSPKSLVLSPKSTIGGSPQTQEVGLRTQDLGPRTHDFGRRIVVAQVAGLLARRIVSWRLPGDELAAGEKLGMIRFGSRTDLLVPAGQAAPLVRPGETVRAGLTPLARYATP
jgi:phosphatidylserine decarboxylase